MLYYIAPMHHPMKGTGALDIVDYRQHYNITAEAQFDQRDRSEYSAVERSYLEAAFCSDFQ